MNAQKSTAPKTLSKWDRLRVLLALSREGSLSAAARLLGVDHTTVARHVESLEETLGAPLFERGAEGLCPTLLGEEIIASAERMEAEVLGLLRRLDSSGDKVTGLVRLTAPPTLCSQLLVPMLKDFRATHPGMQINLIGDNRRLDLGRREADVALRLKRPDAPDLVARPLGKLPFAWYAAAQDLRPFENQMFLGFDDASVHTTPQAYFDKLVPAERIVMRSNLSEILLEAARAGLGCVVTPCLVGDQYPGLRRVAAPQDMDPMTLWLVYHEDLRRSPRLRAAVDLIDAMIEANRSGILPMS